jgi:hypothetical protein
MLKSHTKDIYRKQLHNLNKNQKNLRITNKKPPKKLKHPLDVFKAKNHRILIEKIIKDFKKNGFSRIKDPNLTVQKTILEILTKIKNNTNLIGNQGSNLHIFFPLTGMSTVGYFYKGFLEQKYPKARFTFLVTPKSTKAEYMKEYPIFVKEQEIQLI